MKLAHALCTPVFGLGLLVGCGDGDGLGPVVIEEFDWSGTLAAGERVEIKGVNGAVRALGTSGSTVEVHAVKSGRRDDPSTVTIEIVPHSQGVTICAVYPDVPGEPPNECLPGDAGSMRVRDHDVEVTFTVRVPDGVVFIGRTVSGSITAEGLRADVFARTVSGSVSASTTGFASASTISGSIAIGASLAEASAISGSVTASFTSADWGRDLTLQTVSGNVTARVPANTNAAVLARTSSGTIRSDFSLSCAALGGECRGTLGTGGPTLTLSTLSGNVTLRRGPAS